MNNFIKKQHAASVLRKFIVIVLISFLLSCSSANPGELVLFDFETDAQLDRLSWNCHTLYSLSSEHVTHGSKSLRLELYPSEYPGLSAALKVHDWRHRGILSFDISNPGNTVMPIGIRIDDRDDYPDSTDSYYKIVQLPPGPSSVTIPLEGLKTVGTSRRMDLKTIRAFQLFTPHLGAKAIIYIDYVRLI